MWALARARRQCTEHTSYVRACVRVSVAVAVWLSAHSAGVFCSRRRSRTIVLCVADSHANAMPRWLLVGNTLIARVLAVLYYAQISAHIIAQLCVAPSSPRNLCVDIVVVEEVGFMEGRRGAWCLAGWLGGVITARISHRYGYRYILWDFN